MGRGESPLTAAGPYAGHRAVLTTMHGKEAAIAPAFLHRLALDLRIARHIDTDALSTFTGETPRSGNIVETALAKARLGMRATGETFGVASEGAYGARFAEWQQRSEAVLWHE